MARRLLLALCLVFIFGVKRLRKSTGWARLQSLCIGLGLFCSAVEAPSAWATSVETLPKHIRMAQIKTGFIGGLNQVWGMNGQLYDRGEARSVSFDGATLARVSPQAAELVRALNQFGTRNLGDSIHMGTLDIQTLPEISYVAPVMAYGVSERWTVGLGIPVINYSNRISLSASSSNLSFYRDQLGGNAQLIDDALNVNLVAETKKVIAEKGYRPLESRDESFIGDIQIASLYRLKNRGSWSALYQLGLTLPTGPKDDPNDLMAVNAFGRTVVDNSIVLARRLDSHWTVLPYASLSVTLPDRVDKRVPKNEDDVLPDASARATVTRFSGPSLGVGSELQYTVNRSWSLKGGLEGVSKARDRYLGDGRVDLLSTNSDCDVARIRGGVDYSSINEYRAGRALIPSRVALDVSDTVAGRNIERQLRADVSAALFF